MPAAKKRKTVPKHDADTTVDAQLSGIDESELQETAIPVSSHVLRLASPVFDAMLSANMQESHSKRIEVDIGSPEEMKELYSFLLPNGRSKRVDANNVEGIFKLSDYYQIKHLQEECERFLVATLDVKNADSILRLSSDYNNQHLKD